MSVWSIVEMRSDFELNGVATSVSAKMESQVSKHAFYCLFECLFHVRPSDACAAYSKSDMSWVHFHDIVVSLWSELLMRLSYYIHLVFGKKILAHMEISLTVRSLLYPYSTLL